MAKRSWLTCIGYVVLLFSAVVSTYATLPSHTDWGRLGSLREYAYQFLQLDVSRLPQLFVAALETLLIACAATLIGLILAIGLAWFGKRCVGLVARITYPLARGLIGVSCAGHEIVWALILVSVFGPGALAGALALAVGSMGRIATSALASTNGSERTRESDLSGGGASSLRAFLEATVTEWCGNIGRAAALGLVGAGGLGFLFYQDIVTYNYGGATVVLLAIVGFVALGRILGVGIEQATRRRHGGASAFPYVASLSRDAQRWIHPLAGRAASCGLVLLLLAGFFYFAVQLSTLTVAYENVSTRFVNLFRGSLGEVPALFSRHYGDAVLETIQMAALATLFALLLAMLLAWLTTSWAPRLVRSLGQLGVWVCASVPEPFLAVLLVTVLGFGPVAGVLALTFVGAGIAGQRLVAESGLWRVSTRRDPLNGQYAFSALAVESTRLALDTWEGIFRAALVIGLFGAGGIGWDIKLSMQDVDTERTAVLVFVILGLALASYGLCSWARSGGAESRA